MRFWVRTLAGLALAGLCWGVGSASGYWEIVVLMLVSAALGAVAARPKPGPRFRPDTWKKRDAAVRAGETKAASG